MENKEKLIQRLESLRGRFLSNEEVDIQIKLINGIEKDLIVKFKDFKFCDPTLESDGYGEFPDSFKFSDRNKKYLEEFLEK